MRALLDVNVLIALLDRSHVHHPAAADWMEQEVHHGWASCPLTQNGCLRIMAQPSYPGALPLTAVAERLAEATADPSHAFWPADRNLLSPNALDWTRILGPRQLTDSYLLGLAAQKGGRFVTFDQAVALESVPQATPENLVVLAR